MGVVSFGRFVNGCAGKKKRFYDEVVSCSSRIAGRRQLPFLIFNFAFFIFTSPSLPPLHHPALITSKKKPFIPETFNRNLTYKPF
jgi:hypothetical protein